MNIAFRSATPYFQSAKRAPVPYSTVSAQPTMGLRFGHDNQNKNAAWAVRMLNDKILHSPCIPRELTAEHVGLISAVLNRLNTQERGKLLEQLVQAQTAYQEALHQGNFSSPDYLRPLIPQLLVQHLRDQLEMALD
jgi:hypothetical protein